MAVIDSQWSFGSIPFQFPVNQEESDTTKAAETVIYCRNSVFTPQIKFKDRRLKSKHLQQNPTIRFRLLWHSLNFDLGQQPFVAIWIVAMFSQ